MSTKYSSDIDAKVLDILTWILTIAILFSVFAYFQTNKLRFLSDEQRHMAMVFFSAYTVHLYLIITAFRTVGGEPSQIEKLYYSKRWLGHTKLELVLRHIIVIAALCVSGHIPDVLVNVVNVILKLFGSDTKLHHFTPELNFTLFAFILSAIIILYDILAILFDFIFPGDWKGLKKAFFLNWPEDAAGRNFFLLFPPRPRYLVGDLIALIFWWKFYVAINDSTKNFDFVQYLSFILLVYIALLIYRVVGRVKKLE